MKYSFLLMFLALSLKAQDRLSPEPILDDLVTPNDNFNFSANSSSFVKGWNITF